MSSLVPFGVYVALEVPVHGAKSIGRMAYSADVGADIGLTTV